MGRSQYHYALILLCAFTGSMPLAAQSRSTTSSSTFSVELKPSAAEQYKYASAIIRNARQTGGDRDEALFQEVAALELIPQRWPNERRYGIAAYQQAVSLLAARYSLNAVEIAGRAEKYVGQDPELALIQADKAAALTALGRDQEAEATLRAAIDGKPFAKLDDIRKRIVLKKASFFFERQKRYREASDLVRRAVPLGSGALDAVTDYEKSLELNFAGGAFNEAKADFDTLVRETARARGKKLTPQELQQLPNIDKYIELYRKKLKL
jgi:tetratricopeptide (TPR) repeat protein